MRNLKYLIPLVGLWATPAASQPDNPCAQLPTELVSEMNTLLAENDRPVRVIAVTDISTVGFSVERGIIACHFTALAVEPGGQAIIKKSGVLTQHSSSTGLQDEWFSDTDS